MLERFDTDGLTVETGDLVPGAAVLESFGGRIDGLAQWLQRLGESDRQEDPEVAASAVEFVLEGLHLGRRLNRDELDGSSVLYGA